MTHILLNCNSKLRWITKNRVMPVLASFAREFHHHMLDLCILLKRVDRHIFADTALFVATMRHFRGDGQMIVDPDGPKLQSIAGPHRLEDIACPDRSCQTKTTSLALCKTSSSVEKR